MNQLTSADQIQPMDNVFLTVTNEIGKNIISNSMIIKTQIIKLANAADMEFTHCFWLCYFFQNKFKRNYGKSSKNCR